MTRAWASTDRHRQTQTGTDRHRQTQTGTEVAFDEGLGKLRQHSAAISEHGAGILVIGSAACAEH